MGLTCVDAVVLQQGGLEAAAVGAQLAAVRLAALVDAHVTTQRQPGGELPVAQEVEEP